MTLDPDLHPPELIALADYGAKGPAVSRAAARWAVAQILAHRDGQTIDPDGGHAYVSTYCQHAEADTSLWRAIRRHRRCRLACKECEAPCQCWCHGAELEGALVVYAWGGVPVTLLARRRHGGVITGLNIVIGDMGGMAGLGGPPSAGLALRVAAAQIEQQRLHRHA